MKIIYSSDVHGNISQYEKLLDKSVELGCDLIIIGGDLLPHGTIEKQKEFLIAWLFPYLKKKKLRPKILLIPGNDDWKEAVKLLDEFDKKLFYLIYKEPIELSGIEFIGYPYVPITPFRLKDWEKLDTKDQNLANLRINGFRSKEDKAYEFSFGDEIYSDIIEKDMEKLANKSDPKKTIYVIHSPPRDTALDLTYSGLHVGSLAVRRLIEKYNPLLCLHGHIHESPSITGKFKEQLGKTWIASSGNDPHSGLSFLVIDTKKIEEIERISD